MPALAAVASARLAARAALDKKAEDVVMLDLRRLSTLADWFLILSAQSATQAETIRDAILGTLKGAGVRPRHVEGTPQSGWLLLDYGDVVIHIFLRETRAFYALDRLWGDAPTLSPVEAGTPVRD
jgi:ribosome-associated protein